MVLLLAALHLPLVEKPVVTGRSYFALLLTGDGGWRAIDAGLAAEINRQGIPVAGFLSDEYFREKRTPEELTRDIDSVIAHYAALWRKPRVILIGFSRGADAIPIVLAHMSPASRQRVALVALLGAAHSAELQVVPFWKQSTVPSIALAPLIHQVKGVPILCVHGEDEEESLCDVIAQGDAVELRIPGGHHFGGRYTEIARSILAALPARP
ncbi:MAG: AcvB/VirJ family lysyl-phosphatidylglycerol hydrolase [Acidobacteriota bacterium]